MSSSTGYNPNQPGLHYLGLLLLAGIIDPGESVRVWVDAGTESRTGGGNTHMHAVCDHVGLVDGPFPRTLSAGELLDDLDAGNLTLCACARQSRYVDHDAADDTLQGGFTVDVTDADLDMLLYLHNSSEERLHNPMGVFVGSTPSTVLSRLGHHLATSVPQGAHPRLTEIAAARRIEVLAEADRARRSQEFRATYATRVVLGAGELLDMRRMVSIPSANQRKLLDMTAGLDIGVTRTDLGYNGAPRGTAAEIAARVNPARVWVEVGGSPGSGHASPLPWATDYDPAPTPAGYALALVPAVIAVTLSEQNYLPICLDHGYTAATVRNAIEVADDRVPVTQAIEAVVLATT